MKAIGDVVHVIGRRRLMVVEAPGVTLTRCVWQDEDGEPRSGCFKTIALRTVGEEERMRMLQGFD